MFIGTVITFSQMLFITGVNLPAFLVWNRPYKYLPPIPGLKPRKVPIIQWIIQVAVLISSMTFNNLAFTHNVSLTLQIVFRSGGSSNSSCIYRPTDTHMLFLGLAVSMLFGYLFSGKKYIGSQVVSFAPYFMTRTKR